MSHHSSCLHPRPSPLFMHRTELQTGIGDLLSDETEGGPQTFSVSFSPSPCIEYLRDWPQPQGARQGLCRRYGLSPARWRTRVGCACCDHLSNLLAVRREYGKADNRAFGRGRWLRRTRGHGSSIVRGRWHWCERARYSGKARNQQNEAGSAHTRCACISRIILKRLTFG